MIHIVGTAHSRQLWTAAVRDGTSLDASAAMVQAFERFLFDAADALGATAIGEEMSEEGVAIRTGGLSVARNVCARLGIRHVYCDPDSTERERLGIASKSWDDEEAWKVREAYWANAIESIGRTDESIIFVCGAGHAERFYELLTRSGITARIHRPDWTELGD